MSTRMVDIIERKRDGFPLTEEQIAWFVRGVTTGEIPDYQTAALLMAIYFQGMDRRETVQLTLAMARSGDQLDLHDVAPFVVDKHSSGGVGDKTTLVVQPLVAACGAPVGKMSGRGLGPSGGTLDKMESISGWSAERTLAQFKQQLRQIGLVLAGQTADLAPADGKLYALRDVTGTVSSTPLIAASIMSKKLAGGADAIVLDVKAGSGAFMPDEASARELAQIMVAIGADAGREMTALISDMNQPLGHAVGNALEVKEALATLRGGGPDDFWTHCREIAGHMLLLAGRASSLAQAREMAGEARDSGEAFERFRRMVAAQGGDVAQVDNVQKLPTAPVIGEVTTPDDGVIAAMNTGALGWAAVHLGAGRQRKGQPVDHAVGFVMPVKVGDRVQKGQPLATIHARGPDALQQARQEILAALEWSEEPAPPLPHFYGTISAEGERRT
ncbi:MAG TPA: thymidine phosphorylase [Candidatus Sulfomarinibacteraceae bacterium]|nr:thymidine phosphorylase [Candidatus Sulfomarinibacteraceae bacterium]